MSLVKVETVVDCSIEVEQDQWSRVCEKNGTEESAGEMTSDHWSTVTGFWKVFVVGKVFCLFSICFSNYTYKEWYVIKSMYAHCLY